MIRGLFFLNFFKTLYTESRIIMRGHVSHFQGSESGDAVDDVGRLV